MISWGIIGARLSRIIQRTYHEEIFLRPFCANGVLTEQAERGSTTRNEEQVETKAATGSVGEG